MPAALILALALIALISAYILYGRFLAKTLGVDPARPTPANSQNDGVDYVPAKAPVLMGHHFASIAGAAPIIGPIFAVAFGWIPVFLWVVLGSIFLGGAHDFSSLMASIRHGGKTIGEVIEDHIGKSGKRLFILFAWAVLVLVIAVFTNAVTAVFMTDPSTSTASILFIAVALVFGIAVNQLKMPLVISSMVGVVLLFLCIQAGMRYPIALPVEDPATMWKLGLFAYVFVASVVPVWILLQPRDYLCSFLLYGVLAAGAIGIFIANPTVKAPSFSLHSELGFIFPLLFVTVACGAISGFHSLVASGTTAKQLRSEADAKPVAYGSMLVEGFLAVVAMITAITIFQADYLAEMAAGGPIAVFSNGIGRFMAEIGIPQQAGVTFAALAISAFALTSLDTATRLARFLFQEFFEGDEGETTFLSRNRYVATGVTITAAMALTFSGRQSELWPLFGASNQLLASVALLAVTVWLMKIRKQTWFVRYPMFFMFAVTLTALGLKVREYSYGPNQNFVLMTITVLLFLLAVVLLYFAYVSLQRKEPRNADDPSDLADAPVN